MSSSDSGPVDRRDAQKCNSGKSALKSGSADQKLRRDSKATKSFEYTDFRLKKKYQDQGYGIKSTTTYFGENEKCDSTPQKPKNDTEPRNSAAKDRAEMKKVPKLSDKDKIDFDEEPIQAEKLACSTGTAAMDTSESHDEKVEKKPEGVIYFRGLYICLSER